MRYILDVGAGLYKHYKKWLRNNTDFFIFAFEPNIENYKKLISLKSKLRIGSTRLIILNCALWSKSVDGIPFYIANDINASSLLPFVEKNIIRWKHPIGRRKLKTKHVAYVQTKTLDLILKEFDLEKKYIDLLYIDIQGNSFDVLKGLSGCNISHFKQIYIKVITTSFELYKNQSKIDEILDWMEIHDFEIDKVLDYSRDQEEWLRFLNKNQNYHLSLDEIQI